MGADGFVLQIAAEIRFESGHRTVTLSRIFLERLPNDCVQVAAKLAAETVGTDRAMEDCLAADLGRCNHIRWPIRMYLHASSTWHRLPNPSSCQITRTCGFWPSQLPKRIQNSGPCNRCMTCFHPGQATNNRSALIALESRLAFRYSYRFGLRKSGEAFSGVSRIDCLAIS